MNEKFFDLKKEKQDRIIGAAIRVFACQEYRHASTDDIVREAGISKGLIFHYFENKLGLYSFIYEYSVRFLALELRSALAGANGDFFEGLAGLYQARGQAMRRYPFILQFINRGDIAREEEIREIVREKRAPLSLIQDRLYDRICEGCGLPERDARRLLEMTEITVRAIIFEECAGGEIRPEELERRLTEYLELLRTVTALREERADDME